ncbi:unnamed protein product [Rangifer tarandus platyrhynchus]|uniref:Uncharacterized protein n=2 Tax=Rangifer tarandus platyrhynchus TaxID=3082113 RepID=A0ABN8YG64_RANTA|nr:unnamed protein product [Rangifer tarandus platyrhynchus]CAI9698696.1 unnamed protein product [Rangifer tarandus platyrhynchus]
MYSNEQLSEKRASEKWGGDVEPGRRHRTRTPETAALGPQQLSFGRTGPFSLPAAYSSLNRPDSESDSAQLQKAGSARAHALESPRARGWQGRAHGWEGERGRKRSM